jgi:hypothetical protein
MMTNVLVRLGELGEDYQVLGDLRLRAVAQRDRGLCGFLAKLERDRV